MKHLTILLLFLLGLVAGCSGAKATKTTPEGEATPKDGGAATTGPTREAAPTGPASDLCTDSQCPGVVR